MKLALTCGTLLILATLLAGCDNEQTGASATDESAAPATDLETKAPTTPTGTDAGGRSERSAGEDEAIAFEPPEPRIDNLPFVLQTKIGAARQVVKEDPGNADKVFELGAMYYAHGYPEAAIACLEHATQLRPDGFIHQYALARALHAADRRKAALAAYEKALAIQRQQREEDGARPPYPPARLHRAMLIAETDPARAADLLREALQNNADTAVELKLARVLLQADQSTEAEKIVRRILEASPQLPPAHAVMAEILTAQGKSAEAEEHRAAIGDNATTMEPSDPAEDAVLRAGLDLSAIYRHVTDLFELRQLDNAERWLGLAMQLDETGVRARNMLARIRLLQSLPQEAVRILRDAHNADPDHLPTKSNLAEALMAVKQYDEAEQLLKEVLEAEPTNLPALDRLGMLYEVQERRSAIKPVLDKALEAAQDQPRSLYSLAQLLYRHNLPDAAEQALQTAVDQRPDFVLAWYQLGQIQLQRGATEQAHASLAKCLDLNPVFSAALEAYVQLMMEAGDYAAAEQRLREALDQSPRSPVIMNTLAWILATSPSAEQRQPEEAVSLATKASELTQYGNPGILDTLAAAYAASGDFEKAQQYVADAIDKASALQISDPREQQRVTALVEDYRERQTLYEKSQPYIEE